MINYSLILGSMVRVRVRDKLEADIIAIKSNIKLSKELKLQYIDRKEEMIIILKKEIEKLSPAVNRTQTGKKMFKVIYQ